MLKEGAELNFYDPRVSKKQIMSEFEGKEFDEKVFVSESPLIASKGADAIIILTEWQDFKNLDWENIYKVMRKPAWIFDSRIYLDNDKLKNIGFNVWTLGKSPQD